MPRPSARSKLRAWPACRLGYPAGVSRSSRPSDPAPERRFSGRYEVEWAVDCVAADTFLTQPSPISRRWAFRRLRLALRGGDPAQAALPAELGGGTDHPAGPGAVVNRPKPFGHCPNPGMGIQFIDLGLDMRERIVEIIHTIAYVNDYSN